MIQHDGGLRETEAIRAARVQHIADSTERVQTAMQRITDAIRRESTIDTITLHTLEAALSLVRAASASLRRDHPSRR